MNKPFPVKQYYRYKKAVEEELANFIFLEQRHRGKSVRESLVEVIRLVTATMAEISFGQLKLVVLSIAQLETLEAIFNADFGPPAFRATTIKILRDCEYIYPRKQSQFSCISYEITYLGVVAMVVNKLKAGWEHP